jgi:hypothetical protein
MKLITNIIYTIGAVVLIMYIFLKEYMPEFILKHISIVVFIPLLLILVLEIYKKMKA